MAVAEIKKSMLAPYPILVMDLTEDLKRDNWINGDMSPNDKYFWTKLMGNDVNYYSRIIELSNSNVWRWNYRYKISSITDVINQAFESLGEKKTFAGITTSSNIFWYNEVNINGGILDDARTSYIKTGQFFGELDDSINLTFYSKTNTKSLLRKVSLPIVAVNNPEMERLWAGIYVNSFLSTNMSKNQRNFAVQKSLQHHVLTDVTAFLALESDTIFAPNVQGEGGPFIGENKIQSPNWEVKAYPNPFNQYVHISAQLMNQMAGTTWNLTLLDFTGKEIVHQTGTTSQNNKLEIELNSDQYDLKQGIYFVTLIIGDVSKTMRLVKVG